MDDKPLSSLIGKTIGGFAFTMNDNGTFNYTSLQMLDDKGELLAVINPDYMHSTPNWSPFDDDVTNPHGYTEECLRDISYLRSRHRHTPELEAELIRLHQAGTPPDVFEFGVTEETQRALMDTVTSIIEQRTNDQG